MFGNRGFVDFSTAVLAGIPAAATEMTIMEQATVKTALMARKEELLGLSRRNGESRQPVELDQTRQGRLTRMDALRSQAMSLEVERRREAELMRIDRAMKRLEKNEFGCCVKCGEAIDRRRLEMDLTTPTCIDCASG